MAMLTPFILGNPGWSPYRFLRNLEDEVNRMTGEVFSEVSTGYPPLNVWANETEVIVRAELPGVARDAIAVTVTGNTLNLEGERRQPAEDSSRILREERPYGRFGRTVALPFDVDADGVDAQLKDGVLRLRLPRRKEELPRKLTVKCE